MLALWMWWVLMTLYWFSWEYMLARVSMLTLRQARGSVLAAHKLGGACKAGDFCLGSTLRPSAPVTLRQGHQVGAACHRSHHILLHGCVVR
jgi:hypothetical protein